MQLQIWESKIGSSQRIFEKALMLNGVNAGALSINHDSMNYCNLDVHALWLQFREKPEGIRHEDIFHPNSSLSLSRMQ